MLIILLGNSILNYNFFGKATIDRGEKYFKSVILISKEI